MQFLVGAVRPGNAQMGPDGNLVYDRADVVKGYSPSVELARVKAEDLARKTPGVQYAIFGILEIVEATSKLVHKRVNDNGEVVLKE